MKLMFVSGSPHIRDNSSTKTIMLDVIIALLPALLASALIFGIRALVVTAVCVVVAVLSEYLFQKGMDKQVTTKDYSAVVTGILLAFCLPVGIPLWVAGLGSVIAIVVVKQLFGGIGCNFANPAITARIILMVCSFGGAMTTWTLDGVSSATPLVMLNAGTLEGVPSMMNMVLGNHGGSIGETCALALLVGGMYLLARRVITWHIPVAYIGTVVVFTFCAMGASFIPYHVTGGGLLLGAFFMATDYSTSPITNKGKLIYGVGCGLLTMLIRLWGSSPEGVSYAILLMNIVTPHIDRLTRNKPLGGDAV